MTPPQVLYRDATPRRGLAVIFTIGFGGFWFGFFGYSLLIRGEPFGWTSGIATVLYAALQSWFIAMFIRGGHETFEINEVEVRWNRLFGDDRVIRHEEVESYEIRKNTDNDPQIYVYLKSGKVHFVPMGDDSRVQGILMKLWPYRGRWPEK